jgi:hypothetical protein
LANPIQIKGCIKLNQLAASRLLQLEAIKDAYPQQEYEDKKKEILKSI